MFDALSDRLEGVLSRIRNRGRLSPQDLADAMAGIRSALLEADVNVRVARAFIADVEQRLAGAELSRSLSPGQQVVKAVHEELVAMLGDDPIRISYASRPPTVILLAGLQGAGKTTASMKLARWFVHEGRSPLVCGADLQRPAAVEQLRVLGRQAGIPVFSEHTSPVEVARSAVTEARKLGRDVLIIDTAGRLAIDAELMEEVRQISAAVEPRYTFLVVDAMTGQDAVNVAQAFDETLSLDGVIMSKLDGDARGGAALSVKYVVGKPIAFASTGEHLRDLDLFHPDRMAARILGMGDVLTLIEQAERAFDKEQVEQAAAGLLEGRFTLEDFLSQLQQVRKMGPLSGILSLMPGVPKEIRQAKDLMGEDQVARIEGVIRSMTPRERSNPAIIDGSRKVRIARGSGVAVQDVNQLLKQFQQAQQLIRSPGLLGGLLGKGGGAGMGELLEQMGQGVLPPASGAGRGEGFGVRSAAGFGRDLAAGPVGPGGGEMSHGGSSADLSGSVPGSAASSGGVSMSGRAGTDRAGRRAGPLRESAPESPGRKSGSGSRSRRKGGGRATPKGSRRGR